MDNRSSTPKSCLLHGADPSHCACPTSVSQANSFKRERVIEGLPWPFQTKVGSKIKGPAVIVEYFAREQRGVTVECLEVRSLDHAVVIDLLE
jgi:hypothetical protein